VISSSHAVAKGVITGPDQVHVCYCHAPMRYAWDLQHQYLKEASLEKGPKGWLAKVMLHRMRAWDLGTANGVDVFLANSDFTRRRIMKVYRRESTVVHPPVDVHEFTRTDDKDDFFITASRFVPYKRVDLLVEAFASLPSKRLIVIGDGPDLPKIEAKRPPNVTLLGHQPHAVLRDHMQRARGFVFAAKEDFGIVTLEAQACGTPVIAFGGGGALETVRGLDQPNPTGIFFEEQTTSSLVAAIETFETQRKRLTPSACRANAERFSNEVFRQRFVAAVERSLASARNKVVAIAGP
jgi:glycosyltransferase involved in cell wall biosynthesis